MGAPKQITSFLGWNGLSFPQTIIGVASMAGNQVVLYFDKQEDALLFALAASAVMSAEGPIHDNTTVFEIEKEIYKASRITTEGVLNIT